MQVSCWSVVVAGLLFAAPAAAGIALTPPPPEARVVDFDDLLPASPNFSGTTALRDRYAALGVTFSGAGNDGPAILDEDSNFNVSGYSPPNFLAINSDSTLSDGGQPGFPVTMHFRHPVRYVQFNVGFPFATTMTVQAFDAADNLLSESMIDTLSAMQTMSVAEKGISKIVITSTGSAGVLDDLAFVLDSTVIDFDDVVGAPSTFGAATALRDRYASKGVRFVGIGNEGGAVLDESSGLGFPGTSSPNFVAFDNGEILLTGSPASLPQYILFAPPVKHVEFLVGGPMGAKVTAEVFGFNAEFLAEESVEVGGAMQTLSIDAPSISTLRLSSTATSAVLDDLAFDVDGTMIDFDDLGAPTAFVDTLPLRDRYAALGIQFDGVDGGGPAILDEGSNFFVDGFSAPNFLAFNPISKLSNDAIPALPSTLLFDPPVKRVEFRAGSTSAQKLFVEAFNILGQSIGTNDITLTPALQSLFVYSPGTVRVEITGAIPGVIDDLAFAPVDPCAHDACYAGDALVRTCSNCVTLVCEDNSDCCSDGWNTACAQAVDATCGVTCAPLCGDANDDRRITAPDALLALRTAVGTGTCPLQRCDFTGDAKILAADALAILRTAVGTGPVPACPVLVIM